MEKCKQNIKADLQGLMKTNQKVGERKTKEPLVRKRKENNNQSEVK